MAAFMEVHMPAVVDFMSLLKSLQHRFAPSGWVWTPPKSQLAARLLNEIVLGEETDSFEELRRQTGLESLSHAEMYAMAMQEVGADVGLYVQLIANLGNARAPDPFHGMAGVDPRVAAFVRRTLSYCGPDQPDHVTASAFLFGREDLIPVIPLPTT